MRFSNDKTPYKTGFCASFSRSGRKGIFAKCKCSLYTPIIVPCTIVDERILQTMCKHNISSSQHVTSPHAFKQSIVQQQLVSCHVIVRFRADIRVCTVQPGGGSIIAAGAWQPGRHELATIRSVLPHLGSLTRLPTFSSETTSSDPRSVFEESSLHPLLKSSSEKLNLIRKVVEVMYLEAKTN